MYEQGTDQQNQNARVLSSAKCLGNLESVPTWNQFLIPTLFSTLDPGVNANNTGFKTTVVSVTYWQMEMLVHLIVSIILLLIRINMMTDNFLHLAGEMSVDLNRVFERARVAKEELTPHSPMKVSA